MFLRGKDVAEHVAPINEKSVQPAGIDLSLDEVRVFDSSGTLDLDQRDIPGGKSLETDQQGFFDLGVGAYRIRFREIVEIPSWAVGFCYPRSSLLRMGALIHCAVWDPGYKGRGEALLVVLNRHGIKVRRGARIAQIVFARLEALPQMVYKGKYLYEGL